MSYSRPQLQTISGRLKEKRRFIQVLAGPRQTGKTTLAHQVIKQLTFPSHYATADEPALKDSTWIEQQWEAARFKLPGKKKTEKVLLVLDELQKVAHWSETVKRLWDEDSRSGIDLRAVILGSSPLLMQAGLSESLAGRFENIHIPHWSFSEMQAAFGWTPEQFIFYGGYPGASGLIKEPERWRQYLNEALIETAISRDILLMTRVDKPALLRRLFELGCIYSGQILSYNKMLGQLQDAGNTTTLAHYLHLLDQAGLIAGIPKFSGSQVRQKGSSPKLLVLNTGLMSAQSPADLKEVRAEPSAWGRLVETSVGAHIANSIRGTSFELFYWNERNREVDFVIRNGKRLIAIEVKSGMRKTTLPGMAAFSKLYNPDRKLLVGGQGIPVEDFLRSDVLKL